MSCGESGSRQETGKITRPNRWAIAAAGLCLSGAAACNASPHSGTPSQAASQDATLRASAGRLPTGPGTEPGSGVRRTGASPRPSPNVRYVSQMKATLNYDGLRADGLCQGGGLRPCFAPIRTAPHFAPPGQDPTKNWLNAGTFDSAGHYTSVSWPYEAGDGRPADVLTVVCRVRGDTVYGYNTKNSSSVWDAVVVSAEHSRNHTATVGYEPERWTKLVHGLVIRACSPADNPADAPVVTTPTP